MEGHPYGVSRGLKRRILTGIDIVGMVLRIANRLPVGENQREIPSFTGGAGPAQADSGACDRRQKQRRYDPWLHGSRRRDSSVTASRMQAKPNRSMG